MMELNEVERASNEELIKIAIRNGKDLGKYTKQEMLNLR